MKSFKAIALTLTCLTFTTITAVSSTQAAIISASIKNDNIKENHRHLEECIDILNEAFQLKGKGDELSCKERAEKGQCLRTYKRITKPNCTCNKKNCCIEKTKVFEKCAKSCNACDIIDPCIDIGVRFKVKGLTVEGIIRNNNKITCKKIKKKNACNEIQKDGKPLFEFVVCPISCETFCVESNVPSLSPAPTWSPTASILPTSSISPTASITSDVPTDSPTAIIPV